MSQWVAPSIAAEIWGVSVEHILAGVADGSILSYVDGQFLFVDMDRGGYCRETPRPKPMVSDAEFAALTSIPIDQPTDSIDSNNEHTQDHDPSPHDVSQWRAARAQTSRLRRPPQSRAA